MTTFRTFEEIEWSGWEPAQRATLLFVRRDGRLLLIEKKRGLGAGKINAPGGRIEPGETPVEAAIREVQEEVRVTPHAPVERGRLRFQFADGFSISGAVFLAEGCDGEPRETDEAVPLWIAPADIPYARMWADDRVWIPHMLGGRWFDGRFLFDGDAMRGYRLEAGPGAFTTRG
ncbi:MAG: 8-oxo-dGTP diphosphatase [Lentisphaerae bacterium]|nr:8-oxo-dGTP diphosphatase [Lentisphaerota bacterium]